MGKEGGVGSTELSSVSRIINEINEFSGHDSSTSSKPKTKHTHVSHTKRNVILMVFEMFVELKIRKKKRTMK